MNLNQHAFAVVEALIARAGVRNVVSKPVEGGGRVIDLGVEARGGLAAGLDLARVCLSGLGDVALVAGRVGETPCPFVQVTTDHPVAACLASQYAGWAVQEGTFFAMGSGPMRAAYGKEAVFDKIGFRESAGVAIGVLETRSLPGPSVVAKVAEACRVTPDCVTLLVAPTASLAGGVQIVARSVETALHKLAELGFDVSRVVSAFGSAPLPPVAKKDLAAIGRTNDAILYGASVTLYMTGDDASIEEVGPKVPSSASADHGEPFADIFARYGHDFYKVDPHLFSPAEVVFQNVTTGRSHAFGRPAHDVLIRSFFS